MTPPDIRSSTREERRAFVTGRYHCITYNADLARAPRELVEYVVVHEYTHFAVHNHGPDFRALMDRCLPGWQLLRKRLNKRDWETQVV